MRLDDADIDVQRLIPDHSNQGMHFDQAGLKGEHVIYLRISVLVPAN
jgi:hypothetical protein